MAGAHWGVVRKKYTRPPRRGRRCLPILSMTATTASVILRKSSATGEMFIANRSAVTAIANRSLRLHMEALDYHSCFAINA
jgi:hypothetical protein